MAHLKKASPIKVGFARLLWWVAPGLRHKSVSGIGRICSPTDVTVVVGIPPSDYIPPGHAEFALDVLEDPLIAMLQRTGFGVFDGNGIDLESGLSELWIFIYRQHLVKGITAVQSALKALAVPKNCFINVLDYETTILGVYDELIGYR